MTRPSDPLPDPRDTPPARAPWPAPARVLTYATEYMPSGVGVPRNLVVAFDTTTFEVAASIDGVRLATVPLDIKRMAYMLDGGRFAAEAADRGLI